MTYCKSQKESQDTDYIFERLGCYKDYGYEIDLIDNPKLEINQARRIPHAITDEVKKSSSQNGEIGCHETRNKAFSCGESYGNCLTKGQNKSL